MKRNPHPSGKPISKATPVGRPQWNIVPDGAANPRLQKREGQTNAIGFKYISREEDETD